MNRIIATSAILFFAILPGNAKPVDLTFIHTNDLHSHLLGFAPTLDYNPMTVGNDNTRGGWARIQTVINRVRAERANPVCLVDGGDFMMGSLFHMVARERAIELRLMKEMGYDATTLGNHEFDLKPAGLARIIRAANAYGGLPLIVSSNVVFSKDDHRDDTLEAVFNEGLVRPYSLVKKGGITIGFFGVVGADAAEVSPFAKPVTFLDIISTAKRYVTLLKEQKADLIVCLSHSGINEKDLDASEDVRLARAVPEIDIIISGHTHTLLRKPLIENKTIIVQAGSYSRWVGVLDVSLENGRAALRGYRIIDIDDTIAGDPALNARINAFKQEVSAAVLGPLGLSHDSIIAETDFDLTIGEGESNLGNLIADSMRWYVNRFASSEQDPVTRVVAAIESNGLIRDDVRKGKTGRISVADLFASFPLGIGVDDSMGYPLVSTYLYASEIKKALEILTSVYPLKGDDYFIQVSGLRFTYNPRRVIFDRVTDIWLGDAERGYRPLDYSSSNKRLYRVTANIYNATFLKLIGDFTFGILTIVPKDRDGKPIEDLTSALVDADPRTPGIQEVKEWQSLLTYVRSFKDLNGNGIPDVPSRYRGKERRITPEPSFNPVSLLKRGTWVTWAASGAFIAAMTLVVLAGFLVIKRLRKR